MDIRIVKSARQCHRCESAFEHDQTIHSLTRIVDHELAREDYCENCWEAADREALYSSWKTRYYDPEVAEAEPPENFSPLRQTFYESVERDSREQTAVAYLAAQLLRRQKVFRLIKETEGIDGEPSTVLFNDRLGNRLIEVHDPQLSHDELEHGRGLLMERLYEIEGGTAESEANASPDSGHSETVLEHATNPDSTSQ